MQKYKAADKIDSAIRQAKGKSHRYHVMRKVDSGGDPYAFIAGFKLIADAKKAADRSKERFDGVCIFDSKKWVFVG